MSNDFNSSTMMDAFGAQNGDPLSWERLEERLRPWMQQQLASRRIAFGYTADDVVNATFGDVYRDIATFEVKEGSSFRKWVLTIMLNRVADLQRLENAKKRKAPGLRSMDQADDSSGVGLQVPDEREHRASMIARCQEITADFKHALSELDDEKRRIIELHILNGLTFDEIAREVGRNKAVTVRTIFHRTMEKVREKLKRHDQ